MGNYNIADEFRYIEDPEYRAEVNRRNAALPTMSDMNVHTFNTNCSVTTIQRISDDEYRLTQMFLSADKHNYVTTCGVAPENTDRILDGHMLFSLFAGPVGSYYHDKWADFPEIAALGVD